MPEVETVFVRTEGGSIVAMDLPLPHFIAQRVEAGQIKRVHEDGSPWTDEPEAVVVESSSDEPVKPKAAQPKAAQPKADWVAYAEHQGMSHEDADAMSKADLIKKFS